MPAIAHCVQCGGGLRQVLANDARIADLLVAKRKLVMGKTDRACVVRELRMFECSRVQSDRARLLAACKCDAAVKSPGVRKTRIGYLFTKSVWRPAECRGGLSEIILKKPCLGQRRADAQLVVAAERAAPEHPLKQGRDLIPAAALEGSGNAGEGR